MKTKDVKPVPKEKKVLFLCEYNSVVSVFVSTIILHTIKEYNML